jgi:hypothetical protein
MGTPPCRSCDGNDLDCTECNGTGRIITDHKAKQAVRASNAKKLEREIHAAKKTKSSDRKSRARPEGSLHWLVRLSKAVCDFIEETGHSLDGK